MDKLLQDFRYALRQLFRNPVFTTAAVITLALGIGATSAIFTVMRGVVFDPLPYPHPERLVRITSPVPGVAEGAEWDLSTAQYFHFREHADSLEELGLWQITGQTVRAEDETRRTLTAIVSADMMRLLGASAAHGRILDQRDSTPVSAPVVVLSHDYWQREFAGDTAMIGRTLEIEGEISEIIGVMAPEVRLPGAAGAPGLIERPDLWIALRLDPAGPFGNSHVFMAMGRLTGGVSLDRAREEMSGMTARLHEAFPGVYGAGFVEQFGFRTALTPLKDYQLGDMTRHLWLLFGAIGLVLIIALANVANLFMARVEGRQHELAVRAALGASRLAIARHVLMESMVLAIAGGMLALLAASWGVHLLVAGAPETLPRADNIGLDAGVVVFVVAITALVGIALAALVLARYRHDAAGRMVGGESRTTTAGVERRRTRAGLVAGQVALALVLLVAAGLLIQSFQKLRNIDPGFVPDNVVRVQLHLPFERYQEHAAAWRFYSELIERVEALPGIVSAAAGNPLPVSGEFGCWAQGFEDATVGERLRDIGGTECGDIVVTAPGYFETLGIPLLSGRTFTPADLDHPDTGAVVVSRSFAEQFWPDEDAVGRGVRPMVMPGDPPRYYRVVGVVGDVPAASLEGARAAAIYYPITPVPGEGFPVIPSLNLHLLVNTGGAASGNVVSLVRNIVQELDGAVPVGQVGTLKQDVDASMGRITFVMTLLGTAAVAALFLAAVGLYGVVAYLVARRTNEIGIRMALGAAPRGVQRTVVAGSMKMVGIGLIVGVAGAALLTRLMRGMLYGIGPGDPLTYLLAAGLLSGIALAAAWLPARRAAGMNPVVALREE